MTIEFEVRALASAAAERGGHGRMSMSANEARFHAEIGAIWDALLLIARKLDEDRNLSSDA